MSGKTTFEEINERIRSLPPIEDLSEEDRKFFSSIGSALMTSHLEYLLEERNWLAGIIASASMLDFAGKTRLIWEHKGSIPKSKIDNLNFATTILCLFTSKIITKSEFEKMEKIRDARNKMAHDMRSQVSLSFGKKPNPTLQNLIEEAIKIIKILD